ncbi:MAG TPA: hypothetical protein VFV85_00375 [Conexibacter sp.]|nr:hypothetical protein [Conexibacter sp.]
MERLSIEDLLLIAEAVLGTPAEGLARRVRLGAAAAALAAADRGPDLADRAAVLCTRLVRDRPLPQGNERVALLATLELVARNHGTWRSSHDDIELLAVAIERLTARELSEAAFALWIRERVTTR